MAVPRRPKGYAHSNQPWWYLGTPEEETPELRWPNAILVYDRMRRQDAQVKSVLRAVTLPIQRTTWRLDPDGARPKVVATVARDLGLPVVGGESPKAVRTKTRFSWSEHLALALTMLPFGHSFFEQLYDYDDADGLLHLHKLEWRPPRTISGLDVASDGGLVSLRQHGVPEINSGKDPVIKVDRLVAYVHDREGGNWLGQSLLRPAYKFWMLKDRALRVQNQTLERNGLGVPVYTGSQLPDSVTGEDRQTREQVELDAGSELAQAWRAGDDSGAAIPYSAKLDLKGVEGTLPDADPVIRYYDEQIARAVLAHFLNLGTQTGSWALGSTLGDFFILSLQTIAETIADVATAHVVEDLVDQNFGPDEPAPRIVFDEIGARHPATAEAIKALAACGALRPDDPLERFLRTTYGLPAPDPESVRLPAATTTPAPADNPTPPEGDPEDPTPPREQEQ